MCRSPDDHTGAWNMKNNATSKGSLMEKGFTLVELLVSMVIGLILLLGVGTMYNRYTEANTVQNVSADLQLSGRAAIEFMIREIRMAGFTQDMSAQDNPLSSDHYFGVTEAQSNKIRFTRDVVDPTDPESGIGKVAKNGAEIITYYFDPSDNSLQRQLNELTPNMSRQPLIGGEDGQIQVTRLDFTYLTENEKVITKPDSYLPLIRSIIVTLTAQAPAGRSGMVERTFVERVRLRNLGI